MAGTVVNEYAADKDRANSLGPYSLGFTPTAGNVLLYVVFQRNGGTFTDPSGWTLVAQNPGASGFDDTVVAWIKESDGTETTIGVPTSSGGNAGSDGNRIVVLEIAGISTTATANTSTGTASTALTSAPVTVPIDGMVFAAWAQQGDAARTFTPGTGYTDQESGTISGLHPGYLLEWKTAAATSSYSPAATSSVTSTFRSLSFGLAATTQAGVYADWDGDGFDAPTSDDDLTNHIESWTVTRGASPVITGGAEPGTATIVLNNPEDDRYNPLNAAGPLYGKLVDGVPVWIGVNADGAPTGDDPRGIFGGRIKDVTPILEGGAGIAPTVQLTCEDALGWLGRTPARLADALYRTQGEIRAALLAAAGETSLDLPREWASVPISSWDGSALAGLEALNKASGTRHFVRPADTADGWYQYVARNRQWRLDGTVDGTLDGRDTGSEGWTLSADTVINQQKATVTPVTWTSGAVTVWEAPTLPIGVTSTKPYEAWVEFDDFVDGPVADVNYTGTAPTVTLTPFGTTAKLLITSAGTTTVTGLSIEGALLRRGQAESVVEDDLVSQAGVRGVRAGEELAGEFLGVLATAGGVAAHVVWRYGDPQYRPTLTVEDWLPDMLELDLYDVIAVSIYQLGLVARHFEIVGLTVSWSKGDWLPKVAYVLQECRVQSDPGWFIVGTSLIGGTDILAY